MLSLAFIMGFIGASIALLIGILIFSEISEAIECPEFDDEVFEACNSAKDTAWLVIAILPIALFFALFWIFGGIGGYDDEDEKPKTSYRDRHRKKTLKEKRKESKEKQKLADEKMFGKQNNHEDLLQHSFLTKWLRK